MSNRESVHTEQAPAPFGGAPYSQAMISGDLVFVSGQVPIDPATGALVEGGVAEQTEQVLKNLQAVLAGGGKRSRARPQDHRVPHRSRHVRRR